MSNPLDQLLLDLSRYFRSIVQAWPVWLIVATLIARVWVLDRRCRNLGARLEARALADQRVEQRARDLHALQSRSQDNQRDEFAS